MTTTLPVSEVFGPTVQGEGPHLGRVCGFVRLMGCNLTCSWCDTPYTWDATRYDLASETTHLDVELLVHQVLGLGVDLLVVSGGEPLMHQRADGWAQLLRSLPLWLDVHVETNGTIAPTALSRDLVAFFTVSPKLPHSGVRPSKAHKVAALREFIPLAAEGRACFKYVVQSAEDVALVQQVATALELPRDSVWVMPEGTTPQAQLANLRPITEAAVAAGFNVTPRLHVLAWGAERGR